MLVDDGGFVVGLKVGSERREAKRREQRVFDRAPVRAGGLRQGGEDELDAKRTVRGGHLRRQYDIANNFAIESIVWRGRTGNAVSFSYRRAPPHAPLRSQLFSDDSPVSARLFCS